MTKDFFKALSTNNFEVEGNIFEIEDYTNLADLTSIIDEYREEMLDYQVSNDERIEVISYNIYESSNFWDLLLLINNIRDWRLLPVNQDKLQAKLNEVYEEWLEAFGKNKTEEQKEQKLLELTDEIFLENETYRNIKYIKKGKLNELKSKIKEFVNEKKSQQFQEVSDLGINL